MNFNKAIAVHVEWKENLRNYIKRKDKVLDPEIIEKDTECELGKWLFGEGLKYQSNQYYKELVEDHAEFHKCAAEIVRIIATGNTTRAETMMDTHSSFKELSTKLVTKIRMLRNSIDMEP